MDEKVAKRGYAHWTPKEEAWLKANAHLYTVRTVGPLLPGHPVKSIVWKARLMGCPLKPIPREEVSFRPKTKKKWTEEDLGYLRTHAPTTCIQDMADALGRTYHSVMRKVEELKLPLKRKRAPWKKSEKMALITLLETESAKEIAARLGRPHGGAVKQMRTLKLLAYAGSYSLTRMCEESGYHSYHFEQARDALKMGWRERPHGSTGRYVITEEQYRQMLEWLRVNFHGLEAGEGVLESA